MGRISIMTTHKTTDLEGALLDAAVARAEVRGLTFDIRGEPAQCFVDGQVFSPSTDWSQGGPIIEREGIDLYTENGERFADFGHPARHDGVQWTHTRGPTMLIAAMRAYVASKFGETVDLP